MKKRVLSLLLTAVLLCSMAGLAHAVNGRDLRPDAGESFVPGTVPAQTTATDSMTAPINSLVLCMIERNMPYEENDEFFWSSLYYMLSLYGQMDRRAQFTDDTLILPAETVADYAQALFTHYAGLPDLPVSLVDRVVYDAPHDTYRLARGDEGLSETRIDTVEQMENGALRVTGALVALEDGSDLCRFRAELSANDSMFGYSISGMEIL